MRSDVQLFGCEEDEGLGSETGSVEGDREMDDDVETTEETTKGPFVCRACDRQFSAEKGLRTHQTKMGHKSCETDSPIQCKDCNATFKTNVQLWFHKAKVCKITTRKHFLPKEVLEELKKAQIRCPLCWKIFNGLSTLRAHCGNRHGSSSVLRRYELLKYRVKETDEESVDTLPSTPPSAQKRLSDEDEDIDTPGTSKKKCFTCPKCHKTFEGRSAFQSHHWKKHRTHTKRERFTRRGRWTPEELEEDDRNYKAPVVKKKEEEEVNGNESMSTRTSSPEESNSERNAEEDERKSTSKEDFKCPICEGLFFVGMGTMTDHLEEVHPTEWKFMMIELKKRNKDPEERIDSPQCSETGDEMSENSISPELGEEPFPLIEKTEEIVSTREEDKEDDEDCFVNVVDSEDEEEKEKVVDLSVAPAMVENPIPLPTVSIPSLQSLNSLNDDTVAHHPLLSKTLSAPSPIDMRIHSLPSMPPHITPMSIDPQSLYAQMPINWSFLAANPHLLQSLAMSQQNIVKPVVINPNVMHLMNPQFVPSNLLNGIPSSVSIHSPMYISHPSISFPSSHLNPSFSSISNLFWQQSPFHQPPK